MADTYDGETCVVCFKSVEYFSIGQCDHPVCYECSTRMRVLCLQNECPICRQMLSRVIFSDTAQPYESLRNRPFSEKLFERQYKIAFCSEEIRKAYERILEHCCKLCAKMTPFRTFEQLSDHMRRTHELFYCDLCVKHLKIFSSERKCYTRQELAHHRRKGDVDDTSHRGHPLCQFCDVRYMDTDELYRHLRKEHLYCHLCDADGRNQYYASHAELAGHFRRDHFLCEEGECAGDHLTSVFRTDIDLKAHKANVHGRGMPRAAARQARTLELQFNITPHQFSARQQRSEQGGSREPERPVTEQTPAFSAAPAIDTSSVDQFPRLSSVPPAPPPVASRYQGPSNLARTKDNFPALAGGGSRPVPPPAAPRGPPASAVLKTNGKSSLSIHLQGQPTSASNFRLTNPGGSRITAPPPGSASVRKLPSSLYEDFPTLSVPDDDRPSIGAATPQPPKVALVSSDQIQSLKAMQSRPTAAAGGGAHRALNADAFPALSTAGGPAVPPQWITVSKPKEKPKPTAKAAPAPKIPAASFNPVADFPQLAPNKNKKKQPMANNNNDNNNRPAPPTNPSEEVSKKKDKKIKQNGRIRTLEELDPKGVNANKEQSAWDGKKPDKENASVRQHMEVEQRNGNTEAAITPDNFPALSRRGTSGLTFTNSSGETFSAPLHTYIHPPNFEKRNVDLVRKFAEALGPGAMDKFKEVSRAFRTGGVSADHFYEACRRCLGDSFRSLFPELVALLPDIGKQQALAVGRDHGLEMCAACGQLLTMADLTAHRAVHWPTRSAF